MNADSAILDPAIKPVLKLDFEMPLAEHIELSLLAVWHPGILSWLPPAACSWVASAGFMAGLHYDPNGAGHNWPIGGIPSRSNSPCLECAGEQRTHELA